MGESSKDFKARIGSRGGGGRELGARAPLQPQALDGERTPFHAALLPAAGGDRRVAGLGSGPGGDPGQPLGKHGTCSGLSQEQYFAATRQAFEGFRVPRDFHEGRLGDADRRTLLTKLTGSNPGTPESAIALRCRGKDLAEVRICLSKGLTPIACGPHVRGSCPRQGIRVRPIR